MIIYNKLYTFYSHPKKKIIHHIVYIAQWDYLKGWSKHMNIISSTNPYILTKWTRFKSKPFTQHLIHKKRDIYYEK